MTIKYLKSRVLVPFKRGEPYAKYFVYRTPHALSLESKNTKITVAREPAIAHELWPLRNKKL